MGHNLNVLQFSQREDVRDAEDLTLQLIELILIAPPKIQESAVWKTVS